MSLPLIIIADESSVTMTGSVTSTTTIVTSVDYEQGIPSLFSPTGLALGTIAIIILTFCAYRYAKKAEVMWHVISEAEPLKEIAPTLHEDIPFTDQERLNGSGEL